MKKILMVVIVVGGLGMFFLINSFSDEISNSQSEFSSGSKANSIFENYKASGADCTKVKDILIRGDCFQEVNDKYLEWYLDQSKRDFDFSFQQEQNHWKDIFYYEISPEDHLEELVETEHNLDDEDTFPSGDSNYQRGIETVQEYWYVFSNMIPVEYRESLKSVYWTDTGEDFVLGIGRDEENLEDTLFMISHNVGEYHPLIKATLIHEFGHVLTLGEQQVSIDEEVYLSEEEDVWKEAEEACSTYFVSYGWGCVDESSYLFAYYQQFWDDIFNEFVQIDWAAERDYEDFFFHHEERFFNSYQGTNPEEDIAEAFTFFIMMDRTEVEEGSEMKYEKIRFFYQYDELVALRTRILENIYNLSVENGEFY
ncbi:hypothetical protein SAMN05216389_104162 [Oceanobacillus limi]|uniref:Uncharacterized protein n=1 Tax=Oceanobacillus limi TaxID=930131 RepID=A0A1I0B389_9BACI|nr:hypothetical protein [Oceanobacillus limi]SET01207.1 hypothetical protein SAMN05216389_104162 [Oceanobacillus limi]